MKNNSFIPRFALLALSAWWVPASLGATFGKVIPIGGHAADIALDERRGVLYIANFAGSRIDVLSTSDHALRAPIRVKAQPNSLALSPAGRYLVVTHFPDPPAAPALPPTGAGVTILDLEAGGRRELVLKNKPLAVAFGNGSKALLVTVKPPPTEGTETTSTTGEFLLLDPETAVIETLQLANLSTGTLPVRFGTFPPEVVRASASVSGDGQSIHVLADGETGFAVVRYSVPDNQLRVVGITASPPLGPRVISADRTGSHVLAGWGLVDERFVLLAQFPRPTGQLNIGSHAFDYSRNLIYAQVPVGVGAQAPASPSAPTTPTTPTTPQTPAAPTPAQPPVLDILDADNLTVRERIQLKENLAGKSLLTRDLRTLYAISDSGITVLPVGDLAATPRVATLQEDVVFRGNACDRTLMRQELGIVDLSGANTDFTLKLPDSARGIRLSAGSGTTPATVTLELDPTAFQSQKGTAVISLEITSRGAINIPRSVRILVNTREVDQRGTFQSIPGKLVDILPDPRRQRLYIIRQDTNEVLVLSAGSLERIARLRTGNTPVQMAITLDGRQLLVSNDNSQMINVYDLDTLQQLPYVEFTSGSYPRSIAVTRGAIWVTGRAVAPPHQLHRIDLQARTTLTPKTLGIFSNEINADAVLTTSPTASTMLMAMPEGIGVLYEADFDAFSVARKDLQPLSGAYMAISDERFIINNTVLNRSLVPERRLDLSGTSSGLAMAGGLGLRTVSPSPAGPGIIERFDFDTFATVAPTATVEAPSIERTLTSPLVGQIGQTILPFTRTLAPLPEQNAIVTLSVSGLTRLPWDFDALRTPPAVASVVNAADRTTSVAPGALVTITGENLSPGVESNPTLPAPTSLGEVCATINNLPVPLFAVSPERLEAQIPFDVSGDATLVVRTPGGPGEPHRFRVTAGAPAIFRSGPVGEETGLPLVFRAKNDDIVTFSNPLHPQELAVIYLTGLGQTSPQVTAGDASPEEPVAQTIEQPRVTLGGVPLRVTFAGLVPGFAGLYQLNVVLPEDPAIGMQVPLVISQGGESTTVDVRVVNP